MLNTLQSHAAPTGNAFRPQTARSSDSAGGVNVLPEAPSAGLSGRIEFLSDATELQPALMEIINEARTSIKADFHLLRGPQGQEIARQLARRARQGLRVQLLAWGPSTDAFAEAVRAARSQGLNVRVGRTSGSPNRNGVGKLLVADDRVALVGALAQPSRSAVARKAMLRVSGEAACEVSRQFNHDWADAGGTPLPLTELGTMAATASHALRSTIQVGGHGSQRRSARALVLAGLNRARTAIDLVADQLGDDGVVRALLAAKARGVTVRVLLDGEGMAPAGTLAWLRPDGRASALATLQRAGIPVRRYHNAGAPQAVEARFALVDGETLLFGSQPWTREGFAAGGEVLVEARGGRELALVRATFQHDWQGSFPAEPPSGAARMLGQVSPLLAQLGGVARRFSPKQTVKAALGLHVGVVKYPGGRWKLIADQRG